MNRQRIIFCDFDGTITVNDNIVAIMKHFKPEGWDKLVEQVLSKQISISEGVGAMFALLPSSRQKEVVDYAISNAVIRPGFRELLDYCREQDVKFLVTSGGIDFFVYPLLAPFSIPQENIYCNGSDFTGERIRIVWPHPCDEQCHNECGMCKTTIIRSYPSDRYEKILIGDSVTDFEGAKLVDTVFARSHLIDMCKEIGLPYHPFNDFYDIIDKLQSKEAIRP
ncbi:2-hydroxy-3-keto-5-methylthiopentenyl-1-phosphate phosphatase [Paenibacillus hamazuiensis]|uniref:2-hydroxy-3-keto-5-methylthiopentenyl-1- phosphate phosphatase n=1 Tax=Paenibacillus hamazuiensis TaxID=2936508 RepID=UPI00200FD30D|nr:2-hydroxy-3-keto-5-methylthiopentenyl-1-phosphate phosphatase [Paenibacillus hamazuiensis]